MAELTPEVLATLHDESPEPVFVFAPVREDGRVVDFRYLYSNPVAARMVGTSPAMRFADGLRAGAPEVERSGLLASYCRTMETGEATDRRIQYLSENRRSWLRVSASRAGPVLVVHFWDVTQETETRDALRETELDRDRTELRRAALESLLAHAPAEMAYLRGPSLIYEFVNDRYRARHPGREFLGRPLTEALPTWRDDPLLEAMLEVYRSGAPYRDQEHPLWVEAPNGPERRWFDLAFLPVRGSDEAVEGVLSFAADVTELVRRGRRAIPWPASGSRSRRAGR